MLDNWNQLTKSMRNNHRVGYITRRGLRNEILHERVFPMGVAFKTVFPKFYTNDFTFLLNYYNNEITFYILIWFRGISALLCTTYILKNQNAPKYNNSFILWIGKPFIFINGLNSASARLRIENDLEKLVIQLCKISIMTQQN